MINRRTLLLSGSAFSFVGPQGALAAEIRFPEAGWGSEQRSLLQMRPFLAGGLPRMPPPPTDNKASRDEIRDIRDAQARGISEEKVDRAREELHKPTGDILRARGVVPDVRVAPTIWGIMATMDRDVSIAVAQEALHHGRLPPHVVSPDIADLAGSPQMPAYPSMSYARFKTALGLMRLINDQCSTDYDAVLSDIAESLIRSGAHRRSDLVAADILSEIYLAQATTNPAFADVVEEAKIEMGIHLRLEGCRLPIAQPK